MHQNSPDIWPFKIYSIILLALLSIRRDHTHSSSVSLAKALRFHLWMLSSISVFFKYIWHTLTDAEDDENSKCLETHCFILLWTSKIDEQYFVFIPKLKYIMRWMVYPNIIISKSSSALTFYCCLSYHLG